MTNFENRKELLDVTIEALKSAIRALGNAQQTEEIKKLRNYLENIKSNWDESVGKEFPIHKPVEYNPTASDFHGDSQTPLALKHKIKMLEDELEKVKAEENEIPRPLINAYKDFESKLTHYINMLGENKPIPKNISQIIIDVKNGMKTIHKARDKYNILKHKLGYGSDAKLKKAIFLGEFRYPRGGKMGAKKIATQVMNEGGLIDKNGRLKYHSSMGEPDYKRQHKALSKKIQRWLPSKKLKNK